MIIHYFNGDQIWELQEPPACYHYKFLQFFQYIQENQNNDQIHASCLKSLRNYLYEFGVTSDLLPEHLFTLEFINKVTTLFIAPTLPSLDILTELLPDTIPPEYTQNSNNYNAYWLNALCNIFGDNIDAAIKIWESQPMSVIQALIFERRQSMLINLVKDKLTPEAIADRTVAKLMKAKIDDGTATDWVMNQIIQSHSENTRNIAMESLDDITFSF